MRFLSPCFASAFALTFSFTLHALAQGSTDRAAAIEAFDHAQTLVEQGQFREACPRFAQSQKLDPQLGTLLHLSDCYEQNGQLASAWLGFREAAELAQQKGDPRQTVALERASALRPRLVQLQLQLPAKLPEGTEITRNGTSLTESQWRAAVALDPGSYEIEVTAPGHRPALGRVQVEGEGRTIQFTVPALERIEAAPVAARPSEPPREPSVWEAKWPALVAAGVGVAGGAVWTVFGVQALDAKEQADLGCDVVNDIYTCADQNAQEASEDAVRAGNIATVGMIVTGVGLATAGVLWFTLPDPGQTKTGAYRASRSVSFGVRPLGAELRGTF